MQKRKRHLKLAGHWWLIFRSLSLEWRKSSKREEQREQDGERVKGERERERQGEKDEEKGRGEGEPAQPKPSLCLCEPGKSASEVVITDWKNNSNSNNRPDYRSSSFSCDWLQDPPLQNIGTEWG